DNPSARNKAPSAPTTDISALFVIAVAAGPFLLPVLGVGIGDLTFAVPTVLLSFASFTAAGVARNTPQRRALWVWLSVAAGSAALSSGIAVASALANLSLMGAFYVGLLGTAGLVA